jgi:hypothetical protein
MKVLNCPTQRKCAVQFEREALAQRRDLTPRDGGPVSVEGVTHSSPLSRKARPWRPLVTRPSVASGGVDRRHLPCAASSTVVFKNRQRAAGTRRYISLSTSGHSRGRPERLEKDRRSRGTATQPMNGARVVRWPSAIRSGAKGQARRPRLGARRRTAESRCCSSASHSRILRSTGSGAFALGRHQLRTSPP